MHDQLGLVGWDVLIADAAKVRGIAPLACKTDRIDAQVLAELSRRALVPEIWLPDPAVRAERERARWRLHLVRHRVALKNRIHATLIAFGTPCPVSDLFGVAGRDALGRLALPDPWAADVAVALEVIDELDTRIAPHCRGHLAHAHPQPALRSGRRRRTVGRVDGPSSEVRRRSGPPTSLILRPGGHREMSVPPPATHDAGNT